MGGKAKCLVDVRIISGGRFVQSVLIGLIRLYGELLNSEARYMFDVASIGGVNWGGGV